MKGYLKLLPLCLAIVSSPLLANDSDDNLREEKNAMLSSEITSMKASIVAYNKNAFVNLEIHEVIINNVDTPFENVDETVKQTKNSVDLDKYLQTLGSVQMHSTFNLNSVPNDQDTTFENSYTKRQLVKNNTQTSKKNESVLTYNNGESSNAYLFNIGLKKLMGDSIQMTFYGMSDTDYVVSSGSPSVDDKIERNNSKNSFKQTAAIKLNEYAIISHDVKSSGSDNKTRENRFFIVKITPSTVTN